MVERQYDDVIVDDVERMAQFSRVPDARHLAQVMTMELEELDELSRALIRKAEHHLMFDAMLRGIFRDAPEDRKSPLDGGVDRHQIARLHVGQDALSRSRQRHEMAAD